MLEILQDPSLKEIAGIQHGFFTRVGGVSQGIFVSLNCAPKSADDPEAISENLRRALAHFNHPLTALARMKSVHGNLAVEVKHSLPKEQAPEADAMVTQVPGLILGSDSADCAMVLFADPTAAVIGLAHAGWRGACSGIIEATVKKMLCLGAKPDQITAAISPCIAQDSYEVNDTFQQQFLADDSANESYFKNAVKPGHFFFDLQGYVKDRLLRLHLKKVSTAVMYNTYSDEKRFFSCRRALHRQEPTFGGQLTCIFLQP